MIVKRIVKTRIVPGQPRAKERLHLRVVGGPREPYASQLPATRGECAGGPRPCPLTTCSMNTYLDVTRYGAIKINFPGKEPWEVPPETSCALDVAEAGTSRLVDIGDLFGICRERARQLEEKALEHFLDALKARGLTAAAREWVGEALARPDSDGEGEAGYSGATAPEPYVRIEAVVRLPHIDDPGVTDEQYGLAISRLYAEKIGASEDPKVSLEEPVPRG